MADWLSFDAGKGFLAGTGKRLLAGTGIWRPIAAAVLLLVFVATCVPGRKSEDEDLRYAGPIEIGIGRGEFLAGTDIQYLGKTEDGARVSIGGQPALKMMGDSLNWTGSPMEGVEVDLNLRVLVITEEKLHVAGTAKITIAEPSPQPGAVNTTAPIRYKLPVAYHVETGATLTGTPITYIGETEKGAHLGNIEGYPYREMGDSIVWKGQLQHSESGGAWLDLNLRTVLITENALNVAGTAELWLAP